MARWAGAFCCRPVHRQGRAGVLVPEIDRPCGVAPGAKSEKVALFRMTSVVMRCNRLHGTATPEGRHALFGGLMTVSEWTIEATLWPGER